MAAGASFYSFLAVGASILVFFLMRAFSAHEADPPQAIEYVRRVLQSEAGRETNLTLNRFERNGPAYELTYASDQGAPQYRVIFDPKLRQIELIERQP